MHVLVCRTVSQCSRCGEAKEERRGIQGFVLNLEHTIFLLGWWSREPQECLSLPSPPVTGTSSQACSYVGYEDLDLGPHVDQQVLFPTISPRPVLEGLQQSKT